MTDTHGQERPSPHVSLRDDMVLVIDGFEIKDPDIVDYVREQIAAGADPEHIIEMLLQMGALAATAAGARASAEVIRTAIQGASDSIANVTKGAAESVNAQVASLSDDQGLLQVGLRGIMSSFRQDVEKSVAGEDAPVRKAITTALEKAIKGLNDQVSGALKDQKGEIERLLDPRAATSPLRPLIDNHELVLSIVTEMRRELGIEAAVDEAVELATQNTTFAGLDYEARVMQSVLEIANTAGDMAEAVGGQTGFVRNSKAGDGTSTFFISGGQRARVVFEAKDKSLTQKEWGEEVKKAKQNRRAEGFIGLCSSVDYMPSPGQRIWVQNPLTVVLAYDPDYEDSDMLRLVYQMVKLSTVVHAGSIDEDTSEELAAHITSAIGHMERFNDASKHVSSIEKATKSLRGTLNDLSKDLGEELRLARRVLAPDLTGIDEDAEVAVEEDAFED